MLRGEERYTLRGRPQELKIHFSVDYRSATHDARSHMMHDFPKFNRRIQLAITQPHRRLQAQFFNSVFRNSARTI